MWFRTLESTCNLLSYFKLSLMIESAFHPLQFFRCSFHLILLLFRRLTPFASNRASQWTFFVVCLLLVSQLFLTVKFPSSLLCIKILASCCFLSNRLALQRWIRLGTTLKVGVMVFGRVFCLWFFYSSWVAVSESGPERFSNQSLVPVYFGGGNELIPVSTSVLLQCSMLTQ